MTVHQPRYSKKEFASFCSIHMTELLEQAIAKLKTLSIDEQDAVAALILEELEEERRWDESFARSSEVLANPCSSSNG